MNEYDDIDAMIERAAREEREEFDRAHGQRILDIAAARMQQGSGDEPLVEALSRAWRAKAEADQE